jgi:tripartite-type tricarboxylate transporter receptor subunit TctC
MMTFKPFSKARCWRPLAALALSCMASLACADWPNKPVRMVVSSASGSQVDVLARIYSQHLSQVLKQAVVVDNKPGANGQIAVTNVLTAPADGYTVLFTSASGTVVNQATRPSLPFDVTKDLAAVTQIGSGGGILLITSPRFPAKSVRELVAEVKKRPGQYNYASWGVGSTAHLSMARLATLGELSINHVPYKSVSQILTDLQGGRLEIGFADVTTVIPLVRSGDVRALGITGTHRATLFPDLPTLGEQGFPVDADGWLGVFFSKGTPPEIVNQLHAALDQVHNTPQVSARLRELNISSGPLLTPPAFASKVKKDLEIWTAVAKAAQVSLD